jgi:hypothetical protein
MAKIDQATCAACFSTKKKGKGKGKGKGKPAFEIETSPSVSVLLSYIVTISQHLPGNSQLKRSPIKISVPDDIYQIFSDVIKIRKEVAAIYSAHGRAHDGHQHFIAELERAFDILGGSEWKARVSKQAAADRSAREKTTTTAEEATRNLFEGLHVSDVLTSSGEESAAATQKRVLKKSIYYCPFHPDTLVPQTDFC